MLLDGAKVHLRAKGVLKEHDIILLLIDYYLNIYVISLGWIGGVRDTVDLCPLTHPTLS